MSMNCVVCTFPKLQQIRCNTTQCSGTYPADQYAIQSQFIISIHMPHIIRTVAEVSPSVQPVMLSCNNTHWIHLSQNKSDNGMWHVHMVFSDQQVSRWVITTQSTCKRKKNWKIIRSITSPTWWFMLIIHKWPVFTDTHRNTQPARNL